MEEIWQDIKSLQETGRVFISFNWQPRDIQEIEFQGAISRRQDYEAVPDTRTPTPLAREGSLRSKRSPFSSNSSDSRRSVLVHEVEEYHGGLGVAEGDTNDRLARPRFRVGQEQQLSLWNVTIRLVRGRAARNCGGFVWVVPRGRKGHGVQATKTWRRSAGIG